MRALLWGPEGGGMQSQKVKKFCQKSQRRQIPLNVSFQIGQYFSLESQESKFNTWKSGKSNFSTKCMSKKSKVFHQKVKKPIL